MTYDRALVSTFYDKYGEEEWQRLEATAHGRLTLALHLRFIKRHLLSRARVLDAGCGPGRFAVELARLGARVTLLDLSPGQLDIARAKVAEAGVAGQIESYLLADICDLSALPADAFDVTLCCGGSLNYPIGYEREALRELARVTKPDGTLLVGVMSLWGSIRHALGTSGAGFIGQAEENALWETVETGTIPPLAHVRQPPRHLFTASELVSLLEESGCRVLEVASVPCLGSALYERLEEIGQDEVAWANLIDLEDRASTQSGLLDVGASLLVAAERKGSAET